MDGTAAFQTLIIWAATGTLQPQVAVIGDRLRAQAIVGGDATAAVCFNDTHISHVTTTNCMAGRPLRPLDIARAKGAIIEAMMNSPFCIEISGCALRSDF